MADQATIKAAMLALMKANQARPNSGHRPPNLVVTEDTHVNCGTCDHWDGQGMCKLYQYRTQANEVCDSWAPLPE